MWEVIKPDRARSFGAGTSSDIVTFRDIFGDKVSTSDLNLLKAMHRASRLEKSLWSEIADTLDRLQGNDFEKVVTLKVWTEY